MKTLPNLKQLLSTVMCLRIQMSMKKYFILKERNFNNLREENV